MADKKISALTGATTPLAGTEVLPIVQSGATVKVSVDNLTAGKTVNTGDVIAVKTSSAAVTDGLTVQNLASAAGTEAGIFFSPTTATGNIRGARITGINDGSNVIGLKFYTGTGAAITSKFEMTADGNLAVSTANKGIDFSANANAPGMTSEVLNWYEEGTFTPVFAGLTVGNGSVFGHYRRIGKQVFLTYGFILGSTSAVAALTGVSGFPFTTGTVGASRFFPVTGVAFEGGVGWYGASSAIFSASTSGMGIFSPTNDVGFSATVPFTWGTDDSLSLSATYFVD